MDSNSSLPRLIDDRFTESANKLMRVAYSIAEYKQAHTQKISTSTIFFAAIEWGLNNESEAPQPIRNLAALFSGDLEPEYDRIKSDFFMSTVVPVNPDFELSDEYTATPSVDDIFSHLSVKGEPIGVSDLLFELLEHAYSRHDDGSKFIQLFGIADLSLLDYSTALFRRSKTNLARDPHSPLVPIIHDRPMWICQYRRSENSGLEGRMKPGVIEDWRIAPMNSDELPDLMQVGDITAVWRTVDKSTPTDGLKSRGGITAWAQIEDLPDPSDKESRIKIKLLDTFPQNPISRDYVLRMLSVSGSNWPGQISLGQLEHGQAEVLTHLVSLREEKTAETKDSQVLPSSDRPETDKDLLNRAPLAFSLASLINAIQDDQTKDDQTNSDQTKPGRDDKSQAAFVLHIDSPWGGGKTTFANFLVRILNREAFPKKDNGANEFLPGLDDRIETRWPDEWKNRSWIPVVFNAWEHQHVHPPWWDFYQSIRKGYLPKLPWYERIMHRLSEIWWRITMPGVWTPVLGLIILAVLLIVLSMIFGAGGEGPIATFLRGILGIGDVSKTENLESWKLLLVLFGGGSGLALINSLRNGFQIVINAAGQSGDNQNIGSSDPLDRLRRHFYKTMACLSVKSKRPLIVVIDDLDRCDPEYVVELMRGLLTIFKSQHVVYVLLGDKHWIETAFATVHHNMKGAHREMDASFGTRFAEKVIQLSFLLPTVNEEVREGFVSHLLSPKKPGATSASLSNSEQHPFVQSARSDLIKTIDPIQTKLIVARLQKEAETKFEQNTEERKTVLRGLNIEALMNTVATERYREQVSHSLMDYRSLLPDNPRRIKRIINMVAMYQGSAQVIKGVLPDSKEWHQLVRWVILMSEFPELWTCLARSPNLTDILKKADDLGPKGMAKEIPDEDQRKIILQYSTNKRAMGLLQSFEGISDQSGLSTKAVKWLAHITPVK